MSTSIAGAHFEMVSFQCGQNLGGWGDDDGIGLQGCQSLWRSLDCSGQTSGSFRCRYKGMLWNQGSEVKVAQLYPTLCDHMDHTVHGILHARLLEWVAFPCSRGSSQPRNRTQVSRTAGRFFASWATREAQQYWRWVSYPFSRGSLINYLAKFNQVKTTRRT